MENENWNKMLANAFSTKQNNVINLANICTCIIFIVNNGIPIAHGSGVFVDVDGEKFLFTAAHVVESKMEEVSIPVGKKEVITLGGTWLINAVKQHRNEDQIDISILRLSNDSIEKLKGKYSFITEDQLGINHEFKTIPIYSVFGFPATKSKYNSHKKEIKSSPFLLHTQAESHDLYRELGYDEKTNIIVKYDRKNINNLHNLKKMTGPDPHGLSGCGLWQTPYGLSIFNEDSDYQLVAIMIEYRTEKGGHLVGTRIDIFTEILRQNFSLNLKKSQYIKVNIDNNIL